MVNSIANYRGVEVSMRILILVLLAVTRLPAVEITARVDANRIQKNESITFTIEARDADVFPNVDISSLLDNFRILSGPAQQTNIQWVNGKMTSSKSLTWTLLPLKTGSLQIPPLTVSVGNKQVLTQPVTITVMSDPPAGAQPGDDQDLMVVAEVDRDRVFLGQQVTVTYKIYSRINLRGLEYVEKPQSQGFWTEELYAPAQPKFRNTSLQGVAYQVATLYQIAMFPTRTGTLQISPMVLKCQVETRRRSRRRSMFDDFFGDPFLSQLENKIITSEPVRVTVNPLPPGEPAHYSGAVGDFKITATVDTKATSVNEAVTFNISLRGTGNLNLFSLPKVIFPEAMEVFPPQTEFKKDVFRDALTGEHKIEYILIPREAGSFVIPRIRFPYFNPEEQQWQVTSSAPITISVTPGKVTGSEGRGLTKEEVALLGTDIRYIQTAVPRWFEMSSKPVTGWLILVYSVSILAFFFPVIFREFSTHHQSQARHRIARKALSQARKTLSRKTTGQTALVSRVIYRFLQEKFLLDTDNLDPHTVQRLLRDRIPGEQLQEVVELLQTCDAGRFAPEKTVPGDLLVNRALALLTKLDRVA